MTIPRRPRKTSKVRSPRLKEYVCFANIRILKLQEVLSFWGNLFVLVTFGPLICRHWDFKLQNVLLSKGNMYVLETFGSWIYKH